MNSLNLCIQDTQTRSSGNQFNKILIKIVNNLFAINLQYTYTSNHSIKSADRLPEFFTLGKSKWYNFYMMCIFIRSGMIILILPIIKLVLH